MNVIRSVKRPVKEVDYGFVGDVEKVDASLLADLVHKGVVPVMAPLTHDGQGNMLNTNADTIAGETAKALSALFDVTLVYCFEKKGVLRDENDDDSVIPEITRAEFEQYVADGVIQGGMIPKLENSFEAINAGVTEGPTPDLKCNQPGPLFPPAEGRPLPCIPLRTTAAHRGFLRQTRWTELFHSPHPVYHTSA